MNYREWLESLLESGEPQNLQFLQEALAPPDLNFLKSGKLSVDQLYFQGRYRTIKELESLSEENKMIVLSKKRLQFIYKYRLC